MSLESRIDVIEARIHADSVAMPPNNVHSGAVPPNSVPLPMRPNNRGRLGLKLPQQQFMPRNEQENKFRDIMKTSGIISIKGVDYQTEMKDLIDLGELGDGTSGHVVKMRHIPSGEVIAVKQMRRTGNAEENKRIVNDIETALKAQSCPYIVQCLGFIITSADVWICMELMATCFDKLLKRSARPVPEDILGKVTVAVVKALSYLKDKDTMHRDVKPSNILVDERGIIKLCDFGISGQLNNSKAKTRSAGCVAYLAPERIDPKISEYDVRADVWSLGITLVELATGKFPYQGCATDFEVLTCVMQSLPPALPADQGFSLEFQNFVKRCLIHDVNSRPKYLELLQLPFLVYYESKFVNVADWLVGAMKLAGLPMHQRDIILQSPIEGGNVTAGGAVAYATGLQQPTTTNGNSVQSVESSNIIKTSNLPKYAPPAHSMTKFSERNLFIETTTTSTATTTLSPAIQIPPSSRIATAPSNSPNRIVLLHHPSYPQHLMPLEQHPQQLQKGPPVELNKVYRKSPFLPRKKELSEGKPAAAIPKKESKLTSLGNTLLKNLTTSPFSQRKSVAAQQPADVPPPTNPSEDKRPFERYEISGSPIPPVRHHFHNSPLLHRRNPSYVTYNEYQHHHHQMSPGRGSSNTSPIVLQRFYHQQNQLREKGGGDESQLGGIPDYLECEGSTNPFLSYSNTKSPKFQNRFIRDMPSNSNGNYCGSPQAEPNGYGFGGRKWMSEATTGRQPSMQQLQQDELAGYRPSHIPVAEGDYRRIIVNQQDNLRHFPQHYDYVDRTGVSSNGGGASGKVSSEEKTLGDVKRRFASYLKVNVNAHRSREAAELDEQKQQTGRGCYDEEQQQQLGNGENGLRKPAAPPPPLAFAPTNPFLSPEDCGFVEETEPQKLQYLKDKVTIEQRHRSPDPPPRYNRGQSPLLLRKKLEMSNNWGGSPFLSRRLMSGSPPGPPPPMRDCESVPGSPQHFRTRIHYTPEPPQRRFYRHVE